MTDVQVKDFDTFPFAADPFERSVKPTPSYIQIVQPADVIVYESLIVQGQLILVCQTCCQTCFIFAY